MAGGLMCVTVRIIAKVVMSIAVPRNGTIVKTSINSISRHLAQLRRVKKLDDAELRNSVVLEVSGT
jgi:hypothetical protein